MCTNSTAPGVTTINRIVEKDAAERARLAFVKAAERAERSKNGAMTETPSKVIINARPTVVK